MESEINDLLQIDYGYGFGYGCYGSHGNYHECTESTTGHGYGNGSNIDHKDGSGDGFGFADGCGHLDGNDNPPEYGSHSINGFGNKDGTGYGSGANEYDIVELNEKKIYIIDNIATLIDSVHGNYAKGSILNSNLILEPCYIAKYKNYFAHGETLHEAVNAAIAKYEKKLPIEERIRRFNEQYPDHDKKIPAKELFIWHHTLTGSCEMGRKQFCKNHNIDYENGEYSVNEFIQLTKDNYGGEIIKKLMYESTDKTH